ncbi:MAG TPA: hypothetical protein VGJ16_00715 [Pirellulales bacterium]|jgi:uncharacterized membrane protein
MSTRILLGAVVYICVTHTVAVIMTTQSLPETVASHFDLSGAADGQMARDAYVASMVAAGVLASLLMFAFAALLPRLPRSMVNIPHRDYWLSESMIPRVKAYLNLFALRVAVVTVLFLNVLNLLVIEANKNVPPRLDSILLGASVAVFLGCMVVFVVGLIRFFSSAPREPAGFMHDVRPLTHDRWHDPD